MTIRVTLASALPGLLPFGAAAQDQQLHAEARQKLQALNVDVEIPDDATNQWLTEVITITEQGGMTRSHTTQAEMAERVREVFGMEQESVPFSERKTTLQEGARLSSSHYPRPCGRKEDGAPQ